MSRDLVVQAHRDAVLDFGPITRRSEVTGLLGAIDLAAAGTKLWFTVKAARTDSYAAAKIAKTYVAGGASDGFNVVDPTQTVDPNGTISIARAELFAAAVWYWDLTLEEPSERRSTVDGGAFKVVLPVSDPA